MVIDKKLLDNLSAYAASSERLRMNHDLRNSADDTSQRMLNALEPGTELLIHRHNTTTESCFILRGTAVEVFYDNNGNETERVLLRPGSDCVGVNIEAGRWHKLVALEPGTVIFEAKDGPYKPITDDDILTL